MTTTDLYRLLETELNSPDRSAAENLALAEQVELAGSDAVRYWQREVRSNEDGGEGPTLAERSGYHRMGG